MSDCERFALTEYDSALDCQQLASQLYLVLESVHSPFRSENSEPQRRRCRDLFSFLRISIRAYFAFRLPRLCGMIRMRICMRLLRRLNGRNLSRKISITGYYQLSCLLHFNLPLWIRFGRSSDYPPNDP